MAERELSLNLSDGAKDLLVEKGWDPAMGARPLRRAIQRYVEDPLADEVLKAADIAKNATIGFTVGDETGVTYDDMKSKIMGELKKVFRPEFLNRIDEVIVFHKLERAEILEVVDLMMKRVREEMAKHGTVIELTDDAKELLVEKGYDPAMGARPLRRAIQRVIEDPLADFVLGAELTPGATIVVARKEETEDVVITIVAGPTPEAELEKVTVPPEEPEVLPVPEDESEA